MMTSTEGRLRLSALEDHVTRLHVMFAALKPRDLPMPDGWLPKLRGDVEQARQRADKARNLANETNVAVGNVRHRLERVERLTEGLARELAEEQRRERRPNIVPGPSGDFTYALRLLREGKRVRRAMWESGHWVALMTRYVLGTVTIKDQAGVTAVLTTADLLATDWYESAVKR